MRVLYALADGLIYPMMFYIVRYRRKLSYKNLRESFPDKTDGDIRALQKSFYRHFADTIVEIIHSYRASDEEMQQRMAFTNVQEIERLAQANQGCIFMLGHMGNWEYTADIQKRYTLPHLQHYNVYRRLKNKRADIAMRQLREKRSGKGSCIEKNELLRQLFRIRQAEQLLTLGLIADQKPSPGNDYYWTDFLHHDTGFLGGGERLARKYGYAVFYVHITSPKRGYYLADVQLITDNPTNTEPYYITEQFARHLEANILEQPQLWLWTHNRWKWKRNAV
ncbi:MAG: lysophospholipid acyltransferase family protein [Paludibacteraceae bacterium]|nr:lysophospholipid acyltransferase family protein [Paludibacteraceae bacterium]